MIKLSVPDMSCGHCAATIEKAVKSVDGGAKVSVDQAAKTVAIETTAQFQSISKAVDEAGFPNTAV
jgi:copper chaperone